MENVRRRPASRYATPGRRGSDPDFCINRKMDSYPSVRSMQKSRPDPLMHGHTQDVLFCQIATAQLTDDCLIAHDVLPVHTATISGSSS